jgi:type VI secretion system secreted protein Hcp
MAYRFFVAIKGQKQGIIKGSVTEIGYESQIYGLAMDHSIVSSIDPQTGLPTGQRIQKPLVVTKPWDQSTAPLFTAQVTNEALTQCLLTFVRPGDSTSSAAPVAFMTIKLTNAYVESVDRYIADVEQLTRFDASELEDVSLIYETITVTWLNGGLTAGDRWTAVS